MKRTIKLLLSAGLLIAASIILLTGCQGAGDQAAEDFEIEGYMSHSISGDEEWALWGDEGIPDELYSFEYIHVAAVVTNHSDEMYKNLNLIPVAYDAEGNKMEDVFTQIWFEGENFDTYREDKPELSVTDIGAGERSFSQTTFRLAEGAEEPDHIEWEVTDATKLNSDNASFGLEVSSSEDGGGIHFTVTNNSDTDYDFVDTAVIFIDDDGYIADNGIVDMNYLNEDGTEPETLAAHASYDEYIEYDVWDLPRGCRYEIIPMVFPD